MNSINARSSISLVGGLCPALFFGKLTYVSRMKKAGQRPGTHDTLILAIILFMIAYVLYNYFT